MPSLRPPARRARGNVYWLPSGSARVTVYGGIDQLTGKRLQLRETVPAQATRRETEKAAEKVQTKLLNQVDERRSPKTEATVNELLDRWLDVIDVERKTRVGYVGKIEKHIRPRPSVAYRSDESGRTRSKVSTHAYAAAVTTARARSSCSTARTANMSATSTPPAASAQRRRAATRAHGAGGASAHARFTDASRSRPAAYESYTPS